MVLMDPFAWGKCIDIVKQLRTSKHRWFINAMEVMHTTIVIAKTIKIYKQTSKEIS